MAPNTSTKATKASKAKNTNDFCCQKCKSGENEHILLLCDNCDRGYHTTCVGLTRVPASEYWYCPQCLKASLDYSRENETVVTYTRVSSTGQNEPKYGHVGLDSQQTALDKYIRKEGLELEATYTDVGTGRDPDRLECLNQLLEEVYPGMSILVYSVSRLARNAAAGKRLLDFLHSQGAQVYSLLEKAWSYDPKTKTVSTRFTDALRQAAAESQALSQRIKDSVEHIRAEGGHIGPAPFGFSIVRDQVSGIRKTTPNPQEQQTVRLLKTLFEASDCNYTETARQLNSRRIYFREKEWTGSRVKSTLEWN